MAFYVMVADVHVTSSCFSNRLFIFNQSWWNTECHHCINILSVRHQLFQNPICAAYLGGYSITQKSS
jgi:hypothetical protein